MRPDENKPVPHGQTRRQFLRQTGTVAAAAAGAGWFQFPVHAAENHSNLSLVLDKSDPAVSQPPVQWAVEQLRGALATRGVAVTSYDRLAQTPVSPGCILVAGRSSSFAQQVFGDAGISLPAGPETLAMAWGKVAKRAVLATAGSDARGLVYALLELADRASFADDPLAALKTVKPAGERPANAVRSVARAFVSNVEDLAWFRDRAFWSRYLTTLATQRFNRFSLAFGIGYDFTTDISDCYFHFAYPFLLDVPGYHVRAVPLPDAERDANLELLRFISDETARRGMHFQLGLWTHAYHWTKSPNANYTIAGLTPDTQAPYCRDALRALLAACPAIRGITFRIHGESGVPEGHYGLWKTIFDGVATCGRRVEIDMHAKGINQPMIDVALGTKMPVKVSPKYWAEHMGLPYMQGAIRPQERPKPGAQATGFFSLSSGSRSFMRYGYGDLLTEDRRYEVWHRLWPGTQRHLLWGDPETAAAYGRVSSFCGSVGMELFEPLFFKGRKGSGLPGGREAYADASLPAEYDFEKYDYTYRLWGRNLYHPDGDADAWQRRLRKPFGRGATAAEGALAAAGRILPLVTTAHCPSAANNNYWPEMYTNIATVDATRPNPYFDTPAPKRLGTVTPLDPEFFLGIDEFADELLNDAPSGKYSPAWVAQQLEAAAEQAMRRLREAASQARNPHSAEFRRLAIDVPIQAGLGRFFAARFRSGVLYALYLRSGHRPALAAALEANRAARAAWATLAEPAKAPYRPDITYGPEDFQRGHWLDRLPALDADLADMENLLKASAGKPAPAGKATEAAVRKAMRVILGKLKKNARPLLAGLHTPPDSFRRGRPLQIVARAPNAGEAATLFRLRLRYRQVNQAEIWRMTEMEKAGSEYRADIPADYTDSPFPMQYYFQIRAHSGDVWLHPGLKPGWRGQPYFYVRQA